MKDIFCWNIQVCTPSKKTKNYLHLDFIEIMWINVTKDKNLTIIIKWYINNHDNKNTII